MGNFDWKKFVSGVAPSLGMALGGPLAGAAVKILATQLLGDASASEEDVGDFLSSHKLTGEQIVAMRQADHEFELRNREMDIDLEKLNQEYDKALLLDVQDARARQIAVKDYMPQIIFAVLVTIYVMEVVMFFYGKMPEDEFTKALMTRAFGTIEGGLAGAVAYFIGSSRGSKQSGDTIRKIATEK